MRIAIWHNLLGGGAKRALYYQVKGLVERGHYIEAWCPSTATQRYLPLNRLIHEHVLPMPWIQYQPTNIWGEILKFRNIFKKIRQLEKHCRSCAAQINSEKFDVLFASADYYLASPMIGRFVTVPKALYLGEPIRDLYEFGGNHPYVGLNIYCNNRLKNAIKLLENQLILHGYRLKAREEQKSARFFDRILVNSYFSYESIVRCYGLNPKVCYLGIDTEKFVEEKIQKENVIISTGSISPNKRVNLIIKALGKLEDLGLTLLWVGNYAERDYFESMKNLAKDQNVRVDFKIGIPDEQLVELLNKSLLMVYAPKLEPFGFAPLEANACGVPVVAVKEGGLRESIVDGVNGLLTEPDENAIARSIRCLLEDKKLYNRLCNNARAYVCDNWSWNKSVETLESHLLEISGKK